MSVKDLTDEQTTAAPITPDTSEWLTESAAFKKAFYNYEIASDAFGKASQADMEKTDHAQYQALEDAYGVAYVALMNAINGVTDTPPTQEAFSDSRAFQDALEGYDNAIEKFSEASMAGLQTSDRAQFEILNKACSAAYNHLCRVIDAHHDAHQPERASRVQPGYIGYAQHVFEANKHHVLDLLQAACASGTKELTLTIALPFGGGNLKSAHTIKAGLPTIAKFLVTETDGTCFTFRHEADTWKDALAWLQANDTVNEDWRWAICTRDKAGYFHEANLLKFSASPTQREPLTQGA